MSESRFKWSIIGHHHIISYLQHNINEDKVSHAYLFVGPDHVGKNTVVEYFANSLVCENLTTKCEPIPCEKCACCRQIKNKIHPDVFWLKREVNEKTGNFKKNISIEQIRELQNRLNLHSFLNAYKIAVVSGAESLSQEAANSLLKMLEEPSPKTVIILIANNINFLPKTIASRCQLVRFNSVSDKEISDYLVGQKVNRKKAKVITAASYGRPGIAIEYLTDEEAFSAYQEKVKSFCSLHRADTLERFKVVSEIANFSDADQIVEALNIWSRAIRDVVLIKSLNKELIGHRFLLSELSRLASVYQNKKIVQVLNEIDLTKMYLRANVNPRLVLENLVLNLPVA